MVQTVMQFIDCLSPNSKLGFRFQSVHKELKFFGAATSRNWITVVLWRNSQTNWPANLTLSIWTIHHSLSNDPSHPQRRRHFPGFVNLCDEGFAKETIDGYAWKLIRYKHSQIDMISKTSAVRETYMVRLLRVFPLYRMLMTAS